MIRKELKEKAKEYAKSHALFYMSTKNKKIVTSAKEVALGYRTGFNAGYTDGYEVGKKNERDLQCGKNYLEKLEKENKALKEQIYEMKKMTFEEWKAENSHEIEDLADYFMRHDTEDYFVHDKYLEVYDKIESLCKAAFDRE